MRKLIGYLFSAVVVMISLAGLPGRNWAQSGTATDPKGAGSGSAKALKSKPMRGKRIAE